MGFLPGPYRRREIFYEQLATMAQSGLPDLQAIELLARRPYSLHEGRCLEVLRQALQQGRPMSELMGENPGLFTRLETETVRAGERTGTLPEAFRANADTYSILARARGRFMNMLIQPGCLVHALIFIAPIPSLFLESVFAYVGSVLFGLFVVWGFILAIKVFLWICAEAPPLRTFRDEMIWRIPVLGGLARDFAYLRYFRALGRMADSGIALSVGLEVARGTAANVVLERAAARVEETVAAHRPISEGMRKAAGPFTDEAIVLVETGEATGRLPEQLYKIADLAATRLENTGHILAKLMPLAFAILVLAFIAIRILMFWITAYSAL